MPEACLLAGRAGPFRCAGGRRAPNTLRPLLLYVLRTRHGCGGGEGCVAWSAQVCGGCCPPQSLCPLGPELRTPFGAPLGLTDYPGPESHGPSRCRLVDPLRSCLAPLLLPVAVSVRPATPGLAQRSLL